jgi:hypothetical protein
MTFAIQPHIAKAATRANHQTDAVWMWRAMYAVGGRRDGAEDAVRSGRRSKLRLDGSHLLFDIGSNRQAFLISTTFAGSSQTGVSGACLPETPQIPVTLATLPQSIPYTRAPRDATPLARGTGPALGPGTGGERRSKLQTSLQQACNMPATFLQLRRWSGTAPVLPRSRMGPTTTFLQPKGDAHMCSGLRLAW